MLPYVEQDAVAMLWDLAEGKRLYSLDAGEIINALCFSPNRYWLCAATSQCIKACARAPGPRLEARQPSWVVTACAERTRA